MGILQSAPGSQRNIAWNEFLPLERDQINAKPMRIAVT
jgi:hypothetical protein